MKRLASTFLVLPIAALLIVAAFRLLRETRSSAKADAPKRDAVPDPKLSSTSRNSTTDGRSVEDRPSREVPFDRRKLPALYKEALAVRDLRDEREKNRFRELRAELLEALGENPVGVLISLLREKLDEDVAICVLQSLIEIHDAGHKDAVLAHIDGGGLVRPVVLETELLYSLLALVVSREDTPRFRAAVLDKIGPRFKYEAGAFGAIENLLMSDSSGLVKVSAVGVMEACVSDLPSGPAKTVFGYARLYLSDSDEKIRAAAASLLGKDPDGAETLIPALEGEGSPKVRYAILESLTAVGQQPAPETSPETQLRLTKCLILAANDPDEAIAQLAFRTLGRLATSASAGEIYEVLTGSFAKTRGITLREMMIDSLYSMASNGYLRDRIRKELLGYANDTTLPDELRQVASAHAGRLE